MCKLYFLLGLVCLLKVEIWIITVAEVLRESSFMSVVQKGNPLKAHWTANLLREKPLLKEIPNCSRTNIV